MQASIAVLPAPMIVYPVRGAGDVDEPVDGNQPRVRIDAERRRVGRGHRGLEIRRVDDSAPHAHRGFLAGEARHEPVIARVVADVVGHAEEANLTGGHEVLVEHPPEVVADLGRGRPLVQAGVRAGLVDGVVAEDP